MGANKGKSGGASGFVPGLVLGVIVGAVTSFVALELLDTNKLDLQPDPNATPAARDQAPPPADENEAAEQAEGLIDDAQGVAEEAAEIPPADDPAGDGDG